MNCREILENYLLGKFNNETAISEFNNLIQNDVLNINREIPMARYGISFVKRVSQYNSGKITAKDLCVNLRDIILLFGGTVVTDKIYEAVKLCGSEFDLTYNDDFYVSCSLNVPSWLVPKKFVQDVYSLKADRYDNVPTSCGDKLLTDNTNFKTYKSYEQKLAIYTAIKLPHGYNLLVSQPTGGGKSLITQMVSATTNGFTLVIVPTVALAIDQYYSAKKNLKNSDGIYCYNSDISHKERIELINAIMTKTAKLLFISPEAIIKNCQLYEALDKAASECFLRNIIIDEAHIVPDWGVFFRPDFQIFSIVLKKWKKMSNGVIRSYFLSATLADDVVDTLFYLFGEENYNVQIRCDALRKEPRFYFHSTKSKEERAQKIYECVKTLPKPMVIYVLEPKEAVEWQKFLKEKGFSNIPIFTGKTEDQMRKVILKNWKNHEFDIIIATSAFGIGVDKPDVRTIIHACCPENLSRFYQEVGRGGRDGYPSLSVFIPYQSKYDSNSDVRRALGLSNKRVLTVDKAVARWRGMCNSKLSIINMDKCIFDTTATPDTMSDEEAEYAGNLNIAWNINLLLFLHRIGFIELIDVSYITKNKEYEIELKILEPEIFDNEEELKCKLQELRDIEYNSQIQGYNIIKDLVDHPVSKCWGHIFKKLFPLSEEICNGCPFDHNGKITKDKLYKLRQDPNLDVESAEVSSKLKRKISNFSELIIHRKNSGIVTENEINVIAEKASEYKIGALVIPKNVVEKCDFNGFVFDYSEFIFSVSHCPYLFANGVVCIFGDNENENNILYKHLKCLEQYSYNRILYCDENLITSIDGKILRESFEGYVIPIEKF